MKIQRVLAVLAAVLSMPVPFASAARAGEAPESAPGKLPRSCDFEAEPPWKGWTLDPPEPREAGSSEWEILEVEFLGPAGGRTRVEIIVEGAGVLDFDSLELYRLERRRPPVAERRLLVNPGFEAAEDGRPAAALGWTLTGPAARAAGRSFGGAASLRCHMPRPARASAHQDMVLQEGTRYRLALHVRGELTAGAALLRVLPVGSPEVVMAAERLEGSTLRGGRSRCGRISAERGAVRGAVLMMSADAGTNRTLEMFVRGSLPEKGRLRVELCGSEEGEDETLLAARVLTAEALGPDWRPLRVNFALRAGRRLALRLNLEGPGTVEIDDLAVVPPRVVPAVRRITAGDAADNFRPRGRRPLFTSRGKADAEMVRIFTNLVGERMNRPTAFWQFWRSGRAFDHQSRPFEEAAKGRAEDGSVWLLDASRREEAGWLAEHAITVPERPGAYAISASAKALIVAARSEEGFLAAGSALSWLTADGPEPEVFSSRVEDWPSHGFRAAELDFDGRLDASDRALVSSLGAYRLTHLVLTGRGFWELSEPKSRSEARDLVASAASLGLRAVPFLDALGAAPALAEKSPQAVEMVWHRDESHYLRGTERSHLAVRNAVPCAGAPVEVSAPDGRAYQVGRDYSISTPPPRLGADLEAAPRTWLRRGRSSGIPDGGRVLLSYNALPPPREEPSACPRSAEALDAFRAQVRSLLALIEPAGVGLGGRLPARMRTDRRTAGTRFKNGRLTADRVRELVTAAELDAAGTQVYVWGDMLNPCGGLALPEDSPASSAEMLDADLRRKLTVLVRLERSDAAGREMIRNSARFLLGRGFRTAGWVDASSRAADVWAAEVASWRSDAPPA